MFKSSSLKDRSNTRVADYGFLRWASTNYDQIIHSVHASEVPQSLVFCVAASSRFFVHH